MWRKKMVQALWGVQCFLFLTQYVLGSIPDIPPLYHACTNNCLFSPPPLFEIAFPVPGTTKGGKIISSAKNKNARIAFPIPFCTPSGICHQSLTHRTVCLESSRTFNLTKSSVGREIQTLPTTLVSSTHELPSITVPIYSNPSILPLTSSSLDGEVEGVVFTSKTSEEYKGTPKAKPKPSNLVWLSLIVPLTILLLIILLLVYKREVIINLLRRKKHNKIEQPDVKLPEVKYSSVPVKTR